MSDLSGAAEECHQHSVFRAPGYLVPTHKVNESFVQRNTITSPDLKRANFTDLPNQTESIYQPQVKLSINSIKRKTKYMSFGFRFDNDWLVEVPKHSIEE